MQYIPCAFINGNPVKFGKDAGYLVTTNENEDLTLCVIRETFYEHPDAPLEATLSVKESQIVTRAKKGDVNYPKLNLLFMAQEACKEICKR